MQPIYFAPGVLPFANLSADSMVMQMPDTNAAKVASIVPVEIKKTDTQSVVKQKAIVNLAKPIVGLKKAASSTSKKSTKPVKKLAKGAAKKSIIKKNNKANKKSLNKVKKTAKAILPKKSASKTTNH